MAIGNMLAQGKGMIEGNYNENCDIFGIGVMLY